MLLLVLKNLQLEKLSKIKQWLIAAPMLCFLSWWSLPAPVCSMHLFPTVVIPARIPFYPLFISLCPRLAQHVWIPTARKGRLQTLKPLGKVQMWPASAKCRQPSAPAPCAEPSARHQTHSHRRLTSFLLPGTTVHASELIVLKHRGVLNKMYELGVVHLFYKIVCFRNFFSKRLPCDT